MGNPETFSLRLREARERKKLTQKQLAELAGITAASVSAYEKLDSAKSPSIEIAIQLAKALCVSLDWLAGISDTRCVEHSDDSGEAGQAPLSKYLSAIASLADIGGTVSIEEVEGYQQGFDGAELVEIPVASIVFQHHQIVRFCDGLRKMLNVCDDGTIDRNSYDDWLKGFLTRFDDYFVEVANPAGRLRIVQTTLPPPPRPSVTAADFEEIPGDADLPF